MGGDSGGGGVDDVGGGDGDGGGSGVGFHRRGWSEKLRKSDLAIHVCFLSRRHQTAHGIQCVASSVELHYSVNNINVMGFLGQN